MDDLFEAADPPVIELFAIGTELVIGRIQDTNTFWMANRIAELAGRIRRITQLIDDRDEIVRAFQDSIDRGTRTLIATGGLGPTPDDLTVDAVAGWLGRPVVLSEVAVEDYCIRRSVPRDQLNEGLLRMGRCPAGAEVMPNPAGWAPCIAIDVGLARLFLMPGPPREMQAIFDAYVAPYVASAHSSRSASLRVEVDMWESEVSPLMQATMAAHPGIYLKAYVALRNSAEERLPVDLVAVADDADAARLLLEAALDAFTSRVRERGRAIEVRVEG